MDLNQIDFQSELPASVGEFFVKAGDPLKMVVNSAAYHGRTGPVLPRAPGWN